MLRTTAKNLAALFCLLLFSLLSFADETQQVGIIIGKVVDASTGEGLIGVNILLEGTQKGAAADLDGNYRIVDIPVGTYTLVTSALGYNKVTVSGVEVKPDEITTLNLKLKEEALELGEVVIEAKMLNNTEASLLSIQKNAPALSDGISAEQIKKSPDSDAGDAVKRVTGVTVIGDKYVYVRGMGERYNNTRLNGASIASPEPLKRTVPFDIIAANLLDNMVVNKTFTPDQPGDFAGGSVQLNTKEFPEKLTFSASAASSYNSQTSNQDFLTYQGGNKDWLGIDDGTREIPEIVQNGTQDPNWSTDNSLRKTFAKEFSNVWEPRKISAPLNASRSISLGNQTELFGKQFGYLAALNYGSSYSSRGEIANAYTASVDTANGTTTLTRYQNYAVDRSVRSINWGGILDLNAKLSANHKLSLKSLYTRSSDDETRVSEGEGKEQIFYRNYRLQWTERALLNSQLKGAHEFAALLNSRLEWHGSYSRASYDQPDRRDVYYSYSDNDSNYIYLPANESGFRRFAKMRDDVYEASADLAIPLKVFQSESSKLKVGGLYRTTDRSFPTRKFFMRYQREPGTASPNFTLPAEVIFSEQNIDDYFLLAEISRTLDSYDADMKTGAGYAMADLFLNSKWRAIVGARIENIDQHFNTYPYPGSLSEETAEGGPKHTDVMPSLNLTYKLSEKINLRAAASRTIANPDYAEIVPTEDSDYFEGATKKGNPDIKHTKINNFDLRAEFYPTPGENFSVGLFVKQLKDPIEMVIVADGSSQVLTPKNLVDADNLGAEFEFRKSMASLAPKLGNWISYFSAIGNLTVVSSTVKLKDNPFKPQGGGGILTSSERPMMGQSEYVFNAALAFDHPRWGSSIRLLFNTFGERISEVGGYGLPDTYEQPFDKFDLSFNQKLNKNWAFKFQAINLLNSKVEFKTGEADKQVYKLGTVTTVGLSYSI